MGQDDKQDQPAAEQPAKKPPAHEVLLMELRRRVAPLQKLALRTQEVPMASIDHYDYDRLYGAVAALTVVLEHMEVPAVHRASVAAELCRMHAEAPSSLPEFREVLKKAANAIVPETVM